ncbi:hypothetical protein KBB49_03040 [Candidatus Saccharibacteria bacterium]|nr:hypothetical protein [Candidatus Saccharibacteria bacterium]
MALSFIELEAIRPVTKRGDLLGKEHFRVYGDEIGVTHKLSGHLFRYLVFPDGFKHRYKGLIIDHTKQKEVIIRDRTLEGFSDLPVLIGGYERTQEFVNPNVIAASSVIYIAENPQMLACRHGVGGEVLSALQSMSQLLIAKTAKQ